MQYLFNEKRKHGTDVFPFAYYHLTHSHARYTMNMHWHREFELVRVLKGSFDMTLNERSLHVREGDFVFIHGGVLHSGVPHDSVYECLVFDLQAIRNICPACDPYIRRITEKSVVVRDHFTAEDRSVMEIVPQIFEPMRKEAPGYEMLVTGAIYHLLGIIFSEKLYMEDVPHAGKNEMKKITQLKSVLDYIDENYMNPITLTQLADAAQLTPKAFCRFFRQVTQQTPIDFVNRQRVEHACDELAASAGTITDVALSCGFNDLSYFIKTFKRYMGVTPGEYQR